MEKGKYNSTQRRLRANGHIRELTADVTLTHRDFIQPLFLDESVSSRTALPSLNEISSDTPQSLCEQIAADVQNGIRKFLIFPVPREKADKNFNYTFFLDALRLIRKTFGSTVWIATDVCLCAYTTHGHCGILSSDSKRVLNHETVEELARYAVELAKAGADCIAPSDMMDGRVGAIRKALDENGFDQIAVLGYSAKFSSQFYGPFRDACKSVPGEGTELKDRKSYQISVFNPSDAIESALRDQREGADIIMVKPAVPYLDIITKLKATINAPLAAYHVSGEYQSIELLAERGILERSKAHVEVWTSLKRAGANIIISYAARHARKWIDEIEF